MGKGPQVNQSSIDTQANLANQFAGVGIPAVHTASDYWTSLLKGGTAAQQAVAPVASQIQQQYQGSNNATRNLTPQGGQRNLALSQAPIQESGQLARLYAGVQPMAANALSSLGEGVGGISSSAGSSLTGLAGQNAMAKGQALGGIGQGLGSAAGGFLAGK